MKKIIFASIALIIIVTFIFFKKEAYKPAMVDEISLCRVLNLSTESGYEYVVMAGVVLPGEEDGHGLKYCDNLTNLLKGKKIKYRIILKSKNDGKSYPILPLAYVYLEDGTFVNEKLLREGMALFDQGYFKGNEHFYDLQEEARKNKVGIWGSDNPPEAEYISKKDWRFYHYPECLEVEDLKESEKMYFFFHPPSIPGARIWAYRCSYCAPLFKEKEGLEIDKIYPS